MQRHTLSFSDVVPPHRNSLIRHHAATNVRLTYNARAALFQLLLSLPKDAGDTVLLPAFHCVALVEPVVRAGYQVAYYRVLPDFAIDLEDMASKLSPRVALTVAVHYFGFPLDLAPVVKLTKAHGSYLLEDCAHSYLSRINGQFVGQVGDFAIFSHYKFAPSLVGGGLVVNLPHFEVSEPALPVPIREQVVLAKRLLEEMASNSPKNPLSALFFWLDRLRAKRRTQGGAITDKGQPAVSAFVDDPYLFDGHLARTAMPGFCRWIIEASDWQVMAQTRRSHYQLLSQLISDTDCLSRVFPVLPENVVPWVFPVLLENRLVHEQQLRSLGVPLFTIGEVLHPTLDLFQDRARLDAEAVSKRLMLLPIHHQLSVEDIEGFAKRLNEYVAEAPGRMIE